MSFKPFSDDSSSDEVAGLTMENHGDHVSIYGQGLITKDRQGLMQALDLQKQINAIVTYLQTTDLPKQIESKPVVMVNNPFAR